MSDEVQPQGDHDTAPHGDDATTPDPRSVETPQGEIDPAELQAKLDKAIAESRKWEQRAKKDAATLADMKSRVAQMVEPEKVVDAETRAKELESELNDERRARIRERVARQMQLPDSLADVLKGDTEDEMREHAERLVADLPAIKPKAQSAKDGSNTAGAKPAYTPGQLLAGAVFGN